MKGKKNLFLGLSYEVDVGEEDCKVDHGVEGHQPNNNINDNRRPLANDNKYRRPTLKLHFKNVSNNIKLLQKNLSFRLD